jgi:hypothetical protein
MKLKSLPLQFILLCGVAVVVVILSSCSSSSSDNDDVTTTSAEVSGSITFVESTDVSGRQMKIISETENPEEYMLWAQNRASRQVHFIDFEENGSFTLPITLTDQTLGKNYIIGIVQKDPLQFMGTIYQSSTEDATVAFTGFDIEGDIANLEIEFDISNYHGLIDNLESISSIDVNETLQTRLDDETPIGADNAGKGSASKSSAPNSANTIDQDEDGIPDIFDAMNDGQNYDNADSDNRFESVIYSDSLTSAIMFTNLKIDEIDENSYTVTDSAVVVIEVVPASGSGIASIEADLRHTNFNNSTLDMLPSSYTEVDSYGAEDSLWSASSYKLYEALNSSGETRWTVLIKPNNNDFESGNLIRLKVTLDSGDIEYYFVGFNFKFETIVDNTTTGWLSGSGSRNDPYEIAPTGDLDLTWTLPTDEDGNDITGLSHQFEVFYYDTDELSIDTMVAVELTGTDLTSGTLPEEIIDAKTPTPSYIQVDINSRFPYGDNAANKIYLRREGWPDHVNE